MQQQLRQAPDPIQHYQQQREKMLRQVKERERETETETEKETETETDPNR
jgi:hypothetical protein